MEEPVKEEEAEESTSQPVEEEDASLVKVEEELVKETPLAAEGNQMVVDGTQVVVDGGQVVMEEAREVMEGGQVVMEEAREVMEGAQVVMEGAQVVMEGSQLVMGGSEVVMEEAPVAMEEGGVLVQGPEGLSFDTTMLEESVKNDEAGGAGGGRASPSGGLVMVKQEDLQDTRYGHNQQILGLMAGPEVEGEAGGQEKLLLDSLVSEAMQSPPRPGLDNIVVTTSTIGGPAPTLVRGTPPHAAAGPTRIVVQTNQNTTPKATPGHFLIQVGGAAVPVAAPAAMAAAPATTSPSKNHIVIRAGHNQVPATSPVAAPKEEPGSPGAAGSIFKVIIPEGTTKYTKATTPPAATAADKHEPVRKHVQINLSDGSSAKRPRRYVSHTAQTSPAAQPKPQPPPANPKKLYECPTCNSKFMRPLYLRWVALCVCVCF